MADIDPLRTDHDYLRDLRGCITSCQGMSTLAGLMLGRGVRFVHAEATSANGTPWAAIVVQGEPDVTVLRGVAVAVEKALTEQRIKMREDGLRG